MSNTAASPDSTMTDAMVIDETHIQETQDLSSPKNDSSTSVDINLNTSPEDLLAMAQRNIENLKKKCTILYANYLHCQANSEDSVDTMKAHELYEHAQKQLAASMDALKSYSQLSVKEETKQETKKHSLVPSGLPYLQLKTDTLISKGNQEVFDSVYDFCMQFKTVLEAHSLSMDEHWERLLPMTLNKEDRSWFEEKLKGRKLSWSVAESNLLDHFDTPYRKFLLMVKVWSLKQSDGESTRLYAARYQKWRRQAGLKDGLELVLSFWCSLREQVRKVASVAVSSQYGSKLPDKLEDMVGLVIAATNDSDFLSSATGSAASKYADKSIKGHKRSSERSSLDKADTFSKKQKSFDKKECLYCHKPWMKGHRCKEFLQAREARVTRMAFRGDPKVDENTDLLTHLSLECKSKDKDKDNKRQLTKHIIFPILVNNSIRTNSLLDCGATFSSVDKKFCLTNKIKINYIKAIDKNLITKKNVYQYYLRLADSNSYIRRIGTCTLSVSCNNKTIQKEFEVMNLTNTDEYHISIGLDYMHELNIGLYNVPEKYDDKDSSQEIKEADKRFNNISDLLESVELENERLEHCPACEPEPYKLAIDYIKPVIDRNQAIPKGSFCTVPESVVSLDTPPNVTAYKKPYPVPIKMMGVVDKQVDEWLENGIIERAPANTEWNTPLTVVKKTNGKGEETGHRVCHDPRHINILLKNTDRMPLPVISEIFEDLQGANIYSTLDLKSAFNSLRLNPKDAHKLSFTWRGIQYKPIGTVFGIRHVSSQFQRTMSIVLGDLPFVRFFVDDIVCASKSLEEHKEHLRQVIERLTEVNLKLNPDKCKFYQSAIYLLGFRISREGISMDRRKLANVLEFPKPQCGQDIMRYCGLINYFRNLIPNVSRIMSPLDPLRNEKSLDKLWNDKHQAAFDNLKKALLSDIVLTYPDMNKRFSISCDASATGIGAVLYQTIDGSNKYISFIAKSLSKSERKYSATKRELLALVFALKRFHKYIYGSHFTLYTDHRALTYIHTQRIPNLMMISWMDTILQYDFTIVHLPGISNILPDTLSRLFENQDESNELGGEKAPMRSCAVIRDTLPDIMSGEYFTPPTQEERNKLLLREHSKGHFGAEAILHALKRQGIYWLDLKKDAIELIKSCIPCQRHNIIRKGYNPLRPVLATLPGDSWGIDLTGPFVTSRKGNHYLLVMIDIASKFYVLRAIPDKTAVTVAMEILNVICTFGPMRKLQSDHGSEFINSLVKTIKENIGFEHALISQYHPRSNGASERAVQSAVQTIKKSINGNTADWDMLVAPTQLFLNSKYNVRTKSTPFSLMFGRNPNDFEDFSREKDKETAQRINKELQKKIQYMTEIVYPAIYEQAMKVTEKQKQKFDETHKIIDIPAGATVMIYITEKQSKLDPQYKGYYTVVRKTSAGTYVLRNEKGFIEPRNYPPSLLKVVSREIIPENDIFYEVEAIIGHKKDKNNEYLYRCKWLNYDESHDSWEPADNFTDPKFITDYWRRIGEIPENITAINKANKKILQRVKDQTTTPTFKPIKRKRSTEYKPRKSHKNNEHK
jgi:transposase InsO family protein